MAHRAQLEGRLVGHPLRRAGGHGRGVPGSGGMVRVQDSLGPILARPPHPQYHNIFQYTIIYHEIVQHARIYHNTR